MKYIKSKQKVTINLKINRTKFLGHSPNKNFAESANTSIKSRLRLINIYFV